MRIDVFPGQGSQHKGMGAGLFELFPEEVNQADQILNYSIKILCLEDPLHQLNQTLYTQPALYTVNALFWLQRRRAGDPLPDFLAGHSLGEYNALFAAEAFDFATGLRLVQKRAQLMSKSSSSGSMAAVVGLDGAEVKRVLQENGLDSLDIANYNAPRQVVLAGPIPQLESAQAIFEGVGGTLFRLNVSAPFHSRYMQEASREFSQFLDQFQLFEPKIPVLANVDAQPYRGDKIHATLAQQICTPVNWTDTIRHIMGLDSTPQFTELGPKDVLTKLIAKISAEATPLAPTEAYKAACRRHGGVPGKRIESIVTDPVFCSVDVAQLDGVVTSGSAMAAAGTAPRSIDEITASVEQITGYSLGSSGFRRAYGLHCAYVAGPMHYGISGFRLVASMARNGMLGFLGSCGLSLDMIERAIRDTQAALPNGESFGVGISADLNHPDQEMALVDILLRNDVRVIEAAGFIHHSPALIRYRAAGLQRAADGTVRHSNRIIGKTSRLELAELFLRPPPSGILAQLVADGLISTVQAELAAQLPLADDICALADCGGHTDLTNMSTLLPAVLQLREDIGSGFAPARAVHIGVAGGLGTPHAIASALMLGAEFVETGSINQCTVEAQISASVKDMLQAAHIQDTEYAPAGDMFELGGRVQVLKKGVFFPARANRLYHLWRNFDSLECIAPETQKIIEEKYLHKSFEEAWLELLAEGGLGVEKAKYHSHHRMALVFQMYFQNSLKIALEDNSSRKVDSQIYCGSAMGAFNRWVQDTKLKDWRNREVAEIAHRLLDATALLIRQRLLRFCEISETRIEADQ